MVLKTLDMKNFRIISNAHFDFTKGITVLSATDNGEGKSTVLKALMILLLNTYEGNLEDYTQWGVDKDTGYYLACIFEHDGKEYDTSLTYKKGTSSRVISTDGVEIDQTSEVTNLLKSILDPTLSKAAMVSAEGEIDLISTKPAMRRAHLQSVYDLDFSNQIAELDAEEKQINAEREVKERELYALQQTEYDFKDLLDYPFTLVEYAEKSRKVNVLQEMVTNQQTAVREYETKVQEFERQQARIKALQDDIDQLGVKAQELQRKRADALSRRDSDEYQEQVQKLQSQFDETDWDEPIQNIQQKLDASPETPDIEVLSSQEKKLQESLVEKKLEQNTLESEVANARKELELCQSGKCPTCGRDFDSSDVEAHEEEVAKLQDDLEKVVAEVADIRSKVTIAQDELKEATEIKASRSQIEAELEQAKAYRDTRKDQLIAEIESAKALAEEKKKTIESQIQFIDEAIESASEQAQKVEREIEGLQEELVNPPKRKPSVDSSLQDLIQNLNSEIKDYERVDTLNQSYEEQNKRLTELKSKNEASIELLQGEVATMVEDVKVSKEARKVLRADFPSYVISQMIQTMEFDINDFLGKVYPKHHVSVKETKKALNVVYGPEDSDVIHASGFEKEVFSFAYKYALSKIQDIGILFLDEVDSKASERNSQLFYRTLGSMTDYYNQLFVITQQTLTKEVLENEYGAVVYEFNKGEVTNV